MVLGIFLVLGVTFLFPFGIMVTYTLAVLSDHVKPFCYISYTGNYPIESCIFSLLFNTCSATYICIVFLRYAQLSEGLVNSNLSEKKCTWMRKMNSGALFLGTIGALGLSVAGNFQQRIFHLVHILGVFFCTYCTLGFMCLQTYFSFVLPFLGTHSIVKFLRLVVLLLASFILFTGPIFATYYYFHNKRTLDVFTSRPLINDTSLTIGATYEWMLFCLNQIYIASFCPDFRKIELQSNKIVFLS